MCCVSDNVSMCGVRMSMLLSVCAVSIGTPMIFSGGGGCTRAGMVAWADAVRAMVSR